ncbi:MAG TPA: hypothetical protein VM103_02715 [Candidatus Paceibacterota bacterium]|nr:hypothetical protein [Candidatus Paceibacterota bacterium]
MIFDLLMFAFVFEWPIAIAVILLGVGNVTARKRSEGKIRWLSFLTGMLLVAIWGYAPAPNNINMLGLLGIYYGLLLLTEGLAELFWPNRWTHKQRVYA